MTTFDVEFDASNDLLMEDYFANEEKNPLSNVAQDSAIEFVDDIYYLSEKARIAMEEYRKNPYDVCSFAEFKAELAMA